MIEIFNRINCSMRLKADRFEEACGLLGVTYIRVGPKQKPMGPYFAGLVTQTLRVLFYEQDAAVLLFLIMPQTELNVIFSLK
jgi:hypothetical protein